MKHLVERWIRLFCLADRHEEILGDMAESGAGRGRWRDRARDLISVCFFQSRLRGWGRVEWALAALLGVTCGALFGPGPLGRGPQIETINGRDAAGIFTVEFVAGRLRSASMDGVPFPLEKVERSDGRLLFKTGNPAHDLSIQLFPDGRIAWQGRDGRAAGGRQVPIELDWAREYFAEGEKAGREGAAGLWGVDLLGPILFVDRETRFVVANQSDDEGLLKPRDGLWSGELPRHLNIANTVVTWAGRRWTMVVWPLPSDRYTRMKLLFHELFHRVQPELGISSRDVANDHLGTRDGRIWLRLEWRALAEALLRREEARLRAVGDALAFRARRHSLYPNARQSERALELNEGLAEYTGLVMSGLPEEVLADRAAVELGRREQQESYTRSFAYASGPAYGLLLDQSGAEWRRQVNDKTDLAARLAEALGIEVSGAGAESRVASYDGARIIAQEESRAKRIERREAELAARLVDGPTLTLPVASSFRYSFDPDAATPLPGRGTVYDAARVTDDWGILEVSSGGVLLVRSGTAITHVVVPVALSGPSPPSEGEGWTLQLEEAWRLAPGPRPGSWTMERQD